MDFIIAIGILVAFYFVKRKSGNIKDFLNKKVNNSTHYSNRTSSSKIYERATKKSKKKSDNSNVEKFLYDRLAEMKTDYTKFPFKDKFTVKSKDDLTFTFENKDILLIKKIKNDYILYSIKTISGKKKGKNANLDYKLAIIFLEYFAASYKEAVGRNASHSERFKNRQTGKLYTKQQLKEQETYYKLLDVYESRIEHLDKLDNSDTSRHSLENELKVVERKLNKIKPKTGL